MEEMKKLIVKSFRMEMVGTGLYRALARQYRHRPELSGRFQEFSDQEAMHGRLFMEHYRKNYGSTIRGEKLWLFAGRFAALAMKLLPLEAKLKKVGAAEHQAVRQIEKSLEGGDNNGFHKIIRRILPDEKAHAALHDELFPS